MTKTKITKIQHAYPFAGTIIKYSTTNTYYGIEEANIFGNNIIFARVNPYADFWTSDVKPYLMDKGKIGLALEVFRKADSKYNHIILSANNLINSKTTDLEIDYATENEIRKLKDLVNANQVKMGNQTQVETIEILDVYLIGEIPPHPRLLLPIKDGNMQYWEEVDAYKMIEETKTLGDINEIS